MPATRRAWLSKDIIGIGLTSLFSDMSHEMVTSLLPSVLLYLGAPPFALGAVEGVSDLASSAFKLWGGWFGDHHGRRVRKPLIVLGYAATAVKGALIAFATSWLQVVLVRTLAWAGRGLRGPLRDALMTDISAPGQRGRVFGFHRAMDTVGAVLGPAVAFAMIPLIGVRSVLWLSVVPGLASVLSMALLVRDSPGTGSPRARFYDSLRRLPRPFASFLVSAGLFGLGNFAHSLLILRATQALTPSMGGTAAAAFAVALYTLHNILYSLVSYPAGALSDRLGRRALLLAGYALFAVLCACLALLPPSAAAFVLIFVLAGLYIGLVDTMEGALAADLLPPGLRGTGFGVLATVAGVGDFASSLAVGAIWTAVSPAAAFAYAGAFSLLGAVALLRVRGRSQRGTAE